MDKLIDAVSRVNWRYALMIVVLAQPWSVMPASGQDMAPDAQKSQGGAAREPTFPDQVSFGPSKKGPVYVDSRGMTLYAMDTPVVFFFRRGNLSANKFCTGRCADIWTPFAANADAKPVGLWSVADGAQGPQWTYKGDFVFTFNGDKERGALGGEGVDDLWSPILYTPPAPELRAPGGVTTVFAAGGFILSDSKGGILYTSGKSGNCRKDCADWMPFTAGMASRSVGDWTVVRTGDQPQWAYRGKRVYVGESTPAPKVPSGGMLLRP